MDTRFSRMEKHAQRNTRVRRKIMVAVNIIVTRMERHSLVRVARDSVWKKMERLARKVSEVH